MRMVIYVQPSMYGDSTLSHAIDNYATAVEHKLGWVVTKKSLDEYGSWRSIRTRIMNDDPNVVLLAGDKIDYAFNAIIPNYVCPSLAPFYSDKEPFLYKGQVTIRVNYYSVDRAVSILQANKSDLVYAFNKFTQTKVRKYKNVRFFTFCEDFLDCSQEHYSIPAIYNYKYCKCCDQAAIDEALTEELTLLGGFGHGTHRKSLCGKWASFYAHMLKNVKLYMLVIIGCETGDWVIGSEDWFGHLVVTNPYLQFYLGGGTGYPCGNITGGVLSRMLNGKTYAEAIMGDTINQFFTAYGNPAFCLSSEEEPPYEPPAKTHVTFTSNPTGANILLKKK